MIPLPLELLLRVGAAASCVGFVFATLFESLKIENFPPVQEVRRGTPRKKISDVGKRFLKHKRFDNTRITLSIPELRSVRSFLDSTCHLLKHYIEAY